MSHAAGPQTVKPLETARYEALCRVTRTIAAHRDHKELFQVLARELRSVVNFSVLGVFLYDRERHKMWSHVLETPEGPAQAAFEVQPEGTTVWWVYQNQQPIVIPFVEKETRFPVYSEFAQKYGLRSQCTLPLTTVHGRLGGIGFGSEQPDAYAQEEVCFLSLVADQVALAIDDALQFEAAQRAQAELEKQNERLKLILDVNNSVASNLDLRELLRAVVVNVRRVMQCDGVAVHLPDSESHLRIYALDFPESRGFIKEDVLIPIEGTRPGEVFRFGRTLVYGPLDPPEVHSEACPAVSEGLKATCLLPIVSRDRALGVLALGRRQDRAFTPDDVEFLMQVASQAAIAIENAMAFGLINNLKDQLAQEKLYLEDEIRSDLGFEEIIGRSAALRRVLKKVETVAATESTVLIYGETGTGKELLARAIHNLSSRRAQPFVKLNCAAIPTGLLESELFGHEKGAFTGAIAQRIGRFELAHRGTVFLDEIGEVPLELQPKLLRVLQEREFERLGSTRTLRSDARLIAATNRDLSAMVNEQRFRSDLFYRVNVFPVHLPPLRERPEDIPLLVRHFAEQFGRRMNKRIETVSTETMSALGRYHWPGNVRELQNVIERAVILSSGPALNVPLTDLRPSAATPSNGRNTATLQQAERAHILNALEEANWVVAGPKGAAALLGLKRSTLQSRMRKLGILRAPERASYSEKKA
jgi:formate hydrogenlyase transcriptional activator